ACAADTFPAARVAARPAVVGSQVGCCCQAGECETFEVGDGGVVFTAWRGRDLQDVGLLSGASRLVGSSNSDDVFPCGLHLGGAQLSACGEFLPAGPEQHPVRWTAFVSVSCCHLALG